MLKHPRKGIFMFSVILLLKNVKFHFPNLRDILGDVFYSMFVDLIQIIKPTFPILANR